MLKKSASFVLASSVALQLRKGKVDLHGWVYSILTGDVWVYDFEKDRFSSLLNNKPRR